MRAAYAHADADYQAAYVAAVTPETRTKVKIAAKNDAGPRSCAGCESGKNY